MKKVQDIINHLKSEKIAKGCKIDFISNQITITYPYHKCNLSDPNRQSAKDWGFIESNYSIEKTGNTTVRRKRLDNKTYFTITIF